MNRNQPCSCGSGKRYKHCHGAVRSDPFGALNLALAEQQRGHLAAAEALYEQAREALPGHFDAIHMLGVVKLQLGRFEEALQLLTAVLPLAPQAVTASLKHNLALCLAGLARERGTLDTLAADSSALTLPARFVRANATPEAVPAITPRISVILVDATAGHGLSRTLGSIRDQNQPGLELVAATTAPAPRRSELQAALDDSGAAARLVCSENGDSPAGLVNLAAAAGTGDYLCFLRTGDRWAPAWLRQMINALDGCGAWWGYGGLRVEADDATIVRFGVSPAVDALLREEDALYAHRTASMGFLSFNPIAAGRNLVVHRDLWRQRGGLSGGATEPWLDWAWRTARDDEPVYVDGPGYLIPPDTAALHLHKDFLRMIATSVARSGTNNCASASIDIPNPYLRRGISAYWVERWREIFASQAAEMPSEALLGCAALLGVAPIELPIATDHGSLG
jgi:hypothetical protein